MEYSKSENTFNWFFIYIWGLSFFPSVPLTSILHITSWNPFCNLPMEFIHSLNSSTLNPFPFLSKVALSRIPPALREMEMKPESKRERVRRKWILNWNYFVISKEAKKKKWKISKYFQINLESFPFEIRINIKS